MKKLAISLAVAAALGLTACGDSLEDIQQQVEQEGSQVIAASRVVFDPGAGAVSVPNDLLFLGTTDGTLTLDSGSQNYADPQTALGVLDGWSTQNPFSIELRFAPGVGLNAQSASAPGAVRIFEVVMGGPTSSVDQCRAVPQGVACQLVGELAFGQDFVTAATGNNVAVIPIRPLKAKTTYIVALTNTLQDSEGRAIKPSTTYELLQQDLNTLPLGSAQQRQLQGVINSFESVVSSGGLSRSSIIYTAAVTTQSTADVLATTKQLLAAGIQQGAQPVVQVQDTGLRVSDISPQFPVAQGFGLVRLFQGTVTLPYYSGVPTEDDPMGPLNTSWTARCDSGAIIASLSQEQITAIEAGITDPAQLQNDGFCNAASGGALRDFGLDERRHLTKFNTIPLPRMQASLAVQMTLPDEDVFTKPANGWPVVMLQHGITSCKENMLAVTSALTQAGFATVAIDHPLHGSRGFGPLNASGASCGQQGNATVYMNLGNLPVTRDNLRQSIADMLGLRLALNFTQGAQLDTSTVHVLGHSLGAIAGSSMVALANTPTGNPQLDFLYRVQSVGLAMPGGAVANFLLDSPQFGGLIKASVILGAGDANSSALAGFAIQAGCPMPDSVSQAVFTGCVAQHVDNFLAELTMGGETAALAQISGNLTRFAFAAQTITDSGDPNNYLQQLLATETPVHILMVAGDDENLPDQVIPNGFFSPMAALQAGKMPLAGTEPMARLLQADTVDAVAGPVMVDGATISRFVAGDHGSILSPAASPAVTVEMQSQMASFFATGGATVVVTNPAVLQD
ncbi:VolA/Pla-1 family phospholipase [Alkalimonas sp.]|uniref:VolA/Pla-1 family phospholipase n=1 Tax=Alkalimonas sp. TaxID=1872453 RepID=UPI00263A6DED|nr:VolA/Pla-1 family phospholipase [Alkalimonas sp.]MCC5824833.1 lipase [Alkalimonas sp.]